MPGPDHGRLDPQDRGSHDPGQMGPLLAGETRPMGEEPPDPIQAGHETAEVRVEPVVRFLVGLGIAAALVFILMYIVLVSWRNSATRSEPPLPPLVQSSRGRLPPEPRLQITPLKDYEVFRAGQDSLLESYGWVNRESLVVHIPIERAMQLLMERGVPYRSGLAASSALPPPEAPAGATPGVSTTPPPPAGSAGAPATGGEAPPAGRLRRDDLRLRPPAAPVERVPGPAPADTSRPRGRKSP